MRMLSWTLKTLMLCGCWRPEEWSSPLKSTLYTGYACFVLLLLYSSTLSQLMNVILNIDNADDFAENSYMMLAMVIACCKMTSLLLNRRNIALLSDALEIDPFKPNDDEEIEIRDKFEKVIRSNTLYYTVMIGSSVSCTALSSFFVDFQKKRLMFRAWLPFDYSSTLVFSIVFVHQVFGLYVGAFLHVAADSLLCGFLTVTFCQFEILEHRLRKVTDMGKTALRKCLQQHDQIYRYAAMINTTFKVTICIQFLVSTLVVCFNLCQLVKITGLSMKILQMVCYMTCILTQIFLYCWYGNEVKLKSLQTSNVIFAMDWTSLHINSKKILLMIMKRATIPIEFTSAHIITMNLDSFVGLLKTSYTAYNLLQQTQQN